MRKSGWNDRALARVELDEHNDGIVTIEASIAKAASFLRERLRSGVYAMKCVGSDGTPRVSNDGGHAFVAAFIAEAMSGLFDEIDRTIVLVRLLSEENAGRWGYQLPNSYHDDAARVFHVDADDTAYVLRTLRRLGANRNPECLLSFYREPERLFLTFDSPGPVALTATGSPHNNMLAHPEVNANVFLTLRGTHLEGLIDFEMLRSAQDESGFWRSYFYPSPLFATLLALDVLRDRPAFAETTERAVTYILRSQHADGSWGVDGDPHETALAVAALSGHPARASAMHRGVEHLLATMTGDGRWTSPRTIWEFHFDESDVWRTFDEDGAYLTARCMTALRRATGKLSPFP